MVEHPRVGRQQQHHRGHDEQSSQPRTNGFVFGLGAGFLASDVRWRDVGRSTGNIDTAVVAAYGGTTFGPALLEGAVAATYSDIDVNRRILVRGVELIGLNRQPDPGSFRFSTAVAPMSGPGSMLVQGWSGRHG